MAVISMAMLLWSCSNMAYSPKNLEHAYSFSVPMNYQKAYRIIFDQMYEDHNTAGIIATLDVDGQLYTDIPHGEIIVSSAGVGRIYATKIEFDGTGPDSCSINGYANFERWRKYDTKLRSMLNNLKYQ